VLHVVHVSSDFHKQLDLILHNINKDCLYIDIVFLNFVRGLNLVLPICVGSSFGKVAEGWACVAGGKLLYVVGGANFLYVVDVGSWHLFC
jgi:hypothetical protein